MLFLSSRKVGSLALALAVLAVEVVFAWLSSRVYTVFLRADVDGWELEVFQGVIFLTLAVFGFVLATHRHYGVAAIRERGRAGARSGVVGIFLAAGVIIAHDWGAVIYTVLGTGRGATPVLVLVTVGMCGLALVPFLIGRMRLVLAA